MASEQLLDFVQSRMKVSTSASPSCVHLALIRGGGRCSIKETGPSPPGRIDCFLPLQGDREAQYDEEGFRHGRIRPLTTP